MIFVDTSAWFAASCSRVAEHGIARSVMEQEFDTLVTTDYVIDETLTLLRARREHQQALEFGRGIFSGRLARIEYLRQEDIEQGWHQESVCPRSALPAVRLGGGGALDG